MFAANSRMKESPFSATVEAEVKHSLSLALEGLFSGMRSSNFLFEVSGNSYTFEFNFFLISTVVYQYPQQLDILPCN